MLTGAAPDCRPQPGSTSPTLKWSVISVKLSGGGGVSRVSLWLDFVKLHQNACKNVIFYVLSEIKKDLEDVSAGIGIFL
jgi:hypothetical protein